MKAHKWLKWWLVVLTALATAWMLAGCDDDDDDGADDGGGTVVVDGDGDGTADDGAADAAAASVNIAGVWNGTRTGDGGSSQLQFFFQQAGDTLSGDYHDTSGGEAHFTGAIDGDDIQLTLTLTAGWPGSVWTFTGAVNAGGNHIVGHMNTGMDVEDVDATR